MLNNDDRNAIQGLFQRLRDVERRADPRDPEAEALIHDEIARQPGAPYYMAQTMLVQEHALEQAQQRIRELEDDRERGRRSDPFGGFFGNRDDRRPAPRQETSGRGGPWDRQDQRGGGGFLAGAAQTALGVTGGVLLGSAIAGMFGAGAATAAEPTPDAGNDASGSDSADTGSDSDFGDFGGDGGGFDFGGDF